MSRATWSHCGTPQAEKDCPTTTSSSTTTSSTTTSSTTTTTRPVVTTTTKAAPTTTTTTVVHVPAQPQLPFTGSVDPILPAVAVVGIIVGVLCARVQRAVRGLQR